MFYISNTQLIKLSDQQKGTKKVTCAICRPDKKKSQKKYWKVGIKLSINTLYYKKCLCILTLPKRNA